MGSGPVRACRDGLATAKRGGILVYYSRCNEGVAIYEGE